MLKLCGCQQVHEQSREGALESCQVILRYLKGSSNMPLCYDGMDFCLDGYVNSDFADDVDSRRSTAGYVFTLGSEAVSWVSRLQTIVA